LRRHFGIACRASCRLMLVLNNEQCHPGLSNW
jgi:hypothetical protein